MSRETAHLNRSALLADIAVDDPDGRITMAAKPIMSTPAVLAGVAIGYAMLNAFEAGRSGGPLRPAS
ncbi:hypothetical protein [Streptomyces sp. RFCAC02]|uniref:hypothetical protein n=1 Tax=Streptomyces sp. RFCAC02 TaxID=2499143 RepID=UPI001022396D|nr:hypothetical protein [Streptomyces sp. RFCAC02]